MSASVRWFSLTPRCDVFSEIHRRFALLSAIDFDPLLCYTLFARYGERQLPISGKAVARVLVGKTVNQGWV